MIGSLLSFCIEEAFTSLNKQVETCSGSKHSSGSIWPQWCPCSKLGQRCILLSHMTHGALVSAAHSALLSSDYPWMSPRQSCARSLSGRSHCRKTSSGTRSCVSSCKTSSRSVSQACLLGSGVSKRPVRLSPQANTGSSHGRGQR